MAGEYVSKGLRVVAAVGATFLTGSFALGFLTSSISERITLIKKKRHGRSCRCCKAIGYYPCKLCKGNGTIQWSPLYDPVFINPCVCPTCDGFKLPCDPSRFFLAEVRRLALLDEYISDNGNFIAPRTILGARSGRLLRV